MKVLIVFFTVFVGFCRAELKLSMNSLNGLYTVNLTVGEPGKSLNAVIDLFGNNLIIPCYYSYSEDKQVYLPYSSANAYYEDNKKDCEFEKFNKSIDHEYCEKSFEYPPGHEVKAYVFRDTINIYNTRLSGKFFCVKDMEQNSKDTYAVLGLGPESKILSLVFEENYYPKNFNITFQKDSSTLSIGLKLSKLENQEKNLETQGSRYIFRINSVEFTKNTIINLTQSDFSLNSMSKYSYFSIQDYFSILKQLKSSVSSDSSISITKSDSRDCFSNKSSSTIDIKKFPELKFNLKSGSKVSWNPSAYLEKQNENLYCLGIFPSFTSVLGLNFLEGKSVIISQKYSYISISDNVILGQSETTPTRNGSKTTMIIMICLIVILLQIGAGYYFLKRNRSSALQRPNVEFSQVELD